MAKRTRYIVQCRGEIARFSSYRHALLFAEMLSGRDCPGQLVEVSAPDGLVGQYRDGRPTPEFKQHHIDGIFQ